jgi:hypothetical protein
MEKITISVAKNFSTTTGPRSKAEGDFSGEAFREEILNNKFEQAIKENKKLIVNLDNTFGYGTSFLEEAFGGLARTYGKEVVLKHIGFISEEEPYLIDDIEGYINDMEE